MAVVLQTKIEKAYNATGRFSDPVQEERCNGTIFYGKIDDYAVALKNLTEKFIAQIDEHIAVVHEITEMLEWLGVWIECVSDWKPEQLFCDGNRRRVVTIQLEMVKKIKNEEYEIAQVRNLVPLLKSNGDILAYTTFLTHPRGRLQEYLQYTRQITPLIKNKVYPVSEKTFERHGWNPICLPFLDLIKKRNRRSTNAPKETVEFVTAIFGVEMELLDNRTKAVEDILSAMDEFVVVAGGALAAGLGCGADAACSTSLDVHTKIRADKEIVSSRRKRATRDMVRRIPRLRELDRSVWTKMRTYVGETFEAAGTKLSNAVGSAGTVLSAEWKSANDWAERLPPMPRQYRPQRKTTAQPPTTTMEPVVPEECKYLEVEWQRSRETYTDKEVEEFDYLTEKADAAAKEALTDFAKVAVFDESMAKVRSCASNPEAWQTCAELMDVAVKLTEEDEKPST